jgi:hypothetical protein
MRTNPLDTTVTLGQAYELLSEVTASNWDGWAYVQIRLYDPGVSSYYDMYQGLDDELYGYPEGFSGIMRTMPFEVETTSVRLYIEIGIKDDAVGTGTLTINNLKLREVV